MRLLSTTELARHSARLGRLLPRLMEEFGLRRDPKEVLDCADAVLSFYEERAALRPSLSRVRRRTGECLSSGFCEGLVKA